MTGRQRGRRVPLVVLVVAAFALLSSVFWAGVTAVGSGSTSVATWEPNDSMPGMPGIGVDGELAYLTQMVAHHQEAVDAARQLERSGRAEMRRLGASIVATQTAEVTTMNAWLAAWYPGRSTAVAYQAMMRDLSTLSGDALDEAFLRDMIPHHMAAVMMSQQLLVHGRIEHPEVAGFARTVRDAQHAEIIQMQRYLVDRFDGGRRMDSSAPCVAGGRWGPGGMMDW